MQNSSESNDVYHQTELLYRLDQINTAIMISSGVITFPPALFTYFRILTVSDFKSEFLIKLFVLNGFSNLLIYFVNIIEMQFINWPSTYYIYKWLRDTPIPLLFRFMQGFSYSLMWQTTFFISLNRYLCINYSRMMKRNALKYFTISCSCSFVIATVVAFPLFFSGFTYREIDVGDGLLGHYPKYTGNKSLELFATYHQNFISFVTLVLNALIVVKFNELRQDIGENSKMKGKPEHGLLISSILMFLVHLLQTIILIINPYAPSIVLPLFIPLLITIATTVPFWTLIGFAHSLRRTILNGTPLQQRRDMTVTFSTNVTNVRTF